MAGASGGRRRHDANYQLDVPAIAAAITPRTRAVVTVSPNNPTGAVYPSEVAARVNALCRDARRLPHPRRGLRVLHLRRRAARSRPGRSPAPPATRFRSTRCRRRYGMASWRIGYMVMPAGAVGGGQQDPGHAPDLPAGGVAARGAGGAARRPRATPDSHTRAAGPDAPRDLRGAERRRRPVRSARGGRRVLLPDSRAFAARFDDADRAPDPRARSRRSPGRRLPTLRRARSGFPTARSSPTRSAKGSSA